MPDIVVWPAGDDGPGYYRLIFPAEALIEQGADVEVTTTGPNVHWSADWSEYEQPPAWVRPLGCDPVDARVIVLQRPARRWWAELIPHLQAHGSAVVVDVDDRFDRIDDRHVASRTYNERRPHQIVHHEWVNEACKLADLVTASTPALASRYGHGHGMVLPNLVPERYLSVATDKRRHAIGWTGSTETHPGDLETTGGAVASALRGSAYGFHVVGTGVGVKDALGLDAEPTTSGGWVPFGEYISRMAEVEIGIVPLKPGPFNESKSALKMMEFASVGVPVVASPTPDNERLHELGVGRLAPTPNRWLRHLKALMGSSGLRDEMAGQGREVMATLTYEKLAHLWGDAWLSAAKRKVAA